MVDYAQLFSQEFRELRNSVDLVEQVVGLAIQAAGGKESQHELSGDAHRSDGLVSYIMGMRRHDKDPCDSSSYAPGQFGDPSYVTVDPSSPKTLQWLLQRCLELDSRQSAMTWHALNFVYGFDHKRNGGAPVFRFGMGRPGTNEAEVERGIKHFQLCQGLGLVFAGVIHVVDTDGMLAVAVTPLSGRWQGIKEQLTSAVRTSHPEFSTAGINRLRTLAADYGDHAAGLYLDVYACLLMAGKLQAMWRRRGGQVAVVPCITDLAHDFLYQDLRSRTRGRTCLRDVADAYLPQ